MNTEKILNVQVRERPGKSIPVRSYRNAILSEGVFALESPNPAPWPIIDDKMLYM
jgi:hypothetical protein